MKTPNRRSLTVVTTSIVALSNAGAWNIAALAGAIVGLTIAAKPEEKRT